MAWVDEYEQLEPRFVQTFEPKINIPSIVKPLELELKPLSKYFKYVFLK